MELISPLGTNNRHRVQSSKIGPASASTFQPALHPEFQPAPHPEFQPANTAQRGQNGNENALNENKYRNTERGQSKMTIGIEKRQWTGKKKRCVLRLIWSIYFPEHKFWVLLSLITLPSTKHNPVPSVTTSEFNSSSNIHSCTIYSARL